MRVGLAQINPIIGAFEYNLQKILESIQKGKDSGVDLVVFPELTITGYPPMDLLEQPAFIASALNVLEQVKAHTDGIGVVLGLPMPNKGAGKPLFNSAVLLWNGDILGIYHKVLLPSYDVFDETRYFEPGGKPMAFDTPEGKIGITVCEDIWNDPNIFHRRLYHDDPVATLINQGVDVIVNISASPFEIGKQKIRCQLSRRISKGHHIPLIYVNQVGANDSLIFDGGSFVTGRDGNLLAQAREFEEDFIVVDTEKDQGMQCAEERPVGEVLYDALALGVKDYVNKIGFKKVLIGLSGGIDSAVTAAVAVKALGRDRVVGVSMPSRFTSTGTRSDARVLAERLGIEFHEVPIEQPFSAFLGLLSPIFKDKPFDVTEENIQSRIRGLILMAISNKFGYLVLNTGNKTELAVGYCTLYGDMVGGIAVIGDLTKGRVYELAETINRHEEVIPRTIITRPPSAELREDQKDTDTLPPYDILDQIVQLYIEERVGKDQLIKMGFDPEVVNRTLHMIRLNEYKRRQAPMALKVTKKAFGIGRRVPIVQTFED